MELRHILKGIKECFLFNEVFGIIPLEVSTLLNDKKWQQWVLELDQFKLKCIREGLKNYF